MTKHRTHSKLNIPFCAGLVLLCLTLFSMHLTSGLYARYVTSDSAEDSARVIKFGNLTLTENSEWNDEQEILVPGKDITKRVIIESSKNLSGKPVTSEVDTYVFVIVGVAGDIEGAKWTYTETETNITFKYGDYLVWEVANGWKSLGYDKVHKKYVYYIELPANQILEETHFIKDDQIIVSDKLTKAVIKTLPADLSIDIQAALVQAYGFENVKAAWNSIAE